LKNSTNIKDLIKNIVPKYKVSVHRNVNDFISTIPEPNRKNLAQEFINDLQNYPETLSRWDIEKVKGRENAYRLRIGRYRIAFVVNKENREIDVTNAIVK
jgi:mRNA interferase RelE/StbE